jgi:hypothetical protein
MATFEEIGETIDREVEKLRRFIEAEVRPATQRQLVTALRGASKSLEELAARLEASCERPAPPGEAR